MEGVGRGGGCESQLINHSTEAMSQGLVPTHVSCHKCVHFQRSTLDTEGIRVVLQGDLCTF